MYSSRKPSARPMLPGTLGANEVEKASLSMLQFDMDIKKGCRFTKEAKQKMTVLVNEFSQSILKTGIKKMLFLCW